MTSLVRVTLFLCFFLCIGGQVADKSLTRLRKIPVVAGTHGTSPPTSSTPRTTSDDSEILELPADEDDEDLKERKDGDAQDVRSALTNYISLQRESLAQLTSDISENNLEGWLRIQMDDFDQLDLIHKSGDKKAHYQVMLKEKGGKHKHENLLVLNHDQGVQYCREHFNNGTLLTIQSAQESTMLVNWLFYKLKIPGKIWLGMARVTKAGNSNYRSYGRTNNNGHNFMWDDGSCLSEFSNWNKCEPNNSGNDENCAEMLPIFYPYPVTCDVTPIVGKWNDVPCNNNIKNYIVCKTYVS